MDLSDLIDGLFQTHTSDNAQRYNDFVVWITGLVDAYVPLVQEQIDNVESWFGDRLEWIEELYDQVYKEKLREKLEGIRD